MSFALVLVSTKINIITGDPSVERKINNNNFIGYGSKEVWVCSQIFFPNYSFANLKNVYIEQPILTSHAANITKRECPTSKKPPSITTNYWTYFGKGKRRNEFAKWHVAQLAEWHNYAECKIRKMAQRNELNWKTCARLCRAFFWCRFEWAKFLLVHLLLLA